MGRENAKRCEDLKISKIFGDDSLSDIIIDAKDFDGMPILHQTYRKMKRESQENPPQQTWGFKWCLKNRAPVEKELIRNERELTLFYASELQKFDNELTSDFQLGYKAM